MKKINYNTYRFSRKETVLFVTEGLIGIGVIAYIFYHSFPAFICLLPLLYFFLKKKKEELCNLRKKELSLQFREMILAVSASLNSGYSIENAFCESEKDMEILYGKNGIIVKELRVLSGRLASNETLESILSDFSNRSAIEDINDFTEIFITAKRSGGDLNAIIRKASAHISEKIEVKREIDTLMSAKKMEQKIMNAVPFLIILYISYSSPGFLNVLYGNVTGITVMTVCFAVYGVAFLIAQKIVSIEV